MKKVAFFVVLAYTAVLVVLTWPILMAAFYPAEIKEFLAAFACWQYWVFIGVLLLCQAGLLLIPVRVMSRRPVSRKHVFLPIIVSGFLIGALVFGIICSLTEFIRKGGFSSDKMAWSAIACGVTIWAVWSVVFCRLAGEQEPRSVVMQQCRRLVQGSVITLLVAVPTHIVARCRDYCCAGVYTFIGITFGLAVMLLAFGPGVYFLYAERWNKLHPQKPAGSKDG